METVMGDCGPVPFCSGHGSCGSSCTCDSGYISRYCDTPWSTYQLTLNVYAYTSMAIYCIIAFGSCYRFVAVVRSKMELQIGPTSPTARLQRKHQNRLRFLWDIQNTVLLLVLAVSVFGIVMSTDPLGLRSTIVHHMLTIASSWLILLASSLVIRFFALIQAKFDARTRRGIGFLNALLVLQSIVFVVLFIASAFGMGETTILTIFDVMTVTWVVAVVTGLSIFTLTVLRAAPGGGLQTSDVAYARREAISRQMLTRVVRGSQIVALVTIGVILFGLFYTDQQDPSFVVGYNASVEFVQCLALVCDLYLMGRRSSSQHSNSSSGTPSGAQWNTNVYAHTTANANANANANAYPVASVRIRPDRSRNAQIVSEVIMMEPPKVAFVLSQVN